VEANCQPTREVLNDKEGCQRIRILGADGSPVWAATVSVRDLMYEARGQAIATGRVASGDMELPDPPKAKTDHSGRASLGPVIEGWLELGVLLQDGSFYCGMFATDLKKEIVVRLL